MFGKTADFGHQCMRFFMEITGGLPKDVSMGAPART
jgi:hypothetical protein